MVRPVPSDIQRDANSVGLCLADWMPGGVQFEGWMKPGAGGKNCLIGTAPITTIPYILFTDRHHGK